MVNLNYKYACIRHAQLSQHVTLRLVLPRGSFQKLRKPQLNDYTPLLFRDLLSFILKLQSPVLCIPKKHSDVFLTSQLYSHRRNITNIVNTNEYARVTENVLQYNLRNLEMYEDGLKEYRICANNVSSAYKNTKSRVELIKTF